MSDKNDELIAALIEASRKSLPTSTRGMKLFAIAEWEPDFRTKFERATANGWLLVPGSLHILPVVRPNWARGTETQLYMVCQLWHEKNEVPK